MKKYKDPNWLINQLKDGKRNKDIAKECNVSTYTISNHVSSLLNKLPFEKLIDFINSAQNPKQLISPKTKAYRKIVDKTNFLPESAQLRERVWYIINNTTNPPKCKNCDSHVKWDYSKQNFREYCSQQCVNRSEDVQKRRENTTMSNYGVKYPASNIKINEKRKQTILQRYGVAHFNQSHISNDFLEILNNKEKLQQLEHLSTIEIAEQLGVCQSVVSKYFRKHEIIPKRKPSSQHERKIVNFIKTNITENVIENSRQIIPPHEIDIYLPEYNIAIEFNGLYWHSELAGKNKYYHVNKTIACNKKNIRLIHIFEPMWLNNQHLVLSRLRNLLNRVNERIFARKCKIVRNLPTSTVRSFLNKNHIQGYAASSFNNGLMYNGKLISVMTFGKSRYNSKYEYELIRFCSEQNISVVGGASKLFKDFIKQHNPSTVISYSDRCWNTGNVYRQLGFTYSHSSKPNYFYFKENSELLSRVKFQKHKLPAILDKFDSNLSEWENMKANGYNRVWDCGNDVFVWSC